MNAVPKPPVVKPLTEEFREGLREASQLAGLETRHLYEELQHLWEERTTEKVLGKIECLTNLLLARAAISFEGTV